MASEVNGALDDRLKALAIVAGRVSPAMLADTAAMQAFLEERPILMSLFNGGAFATRLDGTAIASVPVSARRVGVNYMDRDYIAALLKEGKAMVGRPVMGKMLQAPVLGMTVPIRDAQGKVIGVLAGSINLGMPNFLDKITRGRYGKTGDYLLVAPQHGLLVTASDKSRIMEILPAPGVNPVLDGRARGDEGTDIFINPRGEEVLSSAKRIPVAGWYASVVMPTAEVFAPIYTVQQHVMLATIVLTLLAGGLTWWMLTRQLAPMLATVKTLAAHSDTKQLLQPLPIARPDEVGQLIGGFNRLLKTLATREDALRKTEQEFRNLAEAMPQIVWITRPDGWNVYFNQQWMDYTGLTREESMGHGWNTPFHPEDQLRAWDAWQHATQTDGVYSIECRLRRADGIYRWWLIRGASVHDESGEVTKWFGTCTDIENLKQSEAELDQYRHHLEELVVSRTSELARAHEAAEAANRANAQRLRLEAEAKMESRKLEALGTLTAGIAHDFNNILGSIVGFAEMTADVLPDDSRAKRNVAQILSASFRARDLIARMFAFARESPVQPVAVDVVVQARETLAMLRASLHPSVQLSFESGMDATSPSATILADPTQIQQVVMNLCINAAHAMDDDGVISIRIDPADKIADVPVGHLDGICLTVADSGSGMTPEVLERMFDPFFTTKAPNKGSGLGLSVVYGIVASLGGVITAQSRISGSDMGTEFRVFLPVEKHPLQIGEMHGAHIADR